MGQDGRILAGLEGTDLGKDVSGDGGHGAFPEPLVWTTLG
jgi:hypothetical protein